MGVRSEGGTGSAPVAVVTDSTAVLPPDEPASAQLRIVPLTVSISGEDLLEGIQVTPEDVARALGERRSAVTTSRPAPAAFTDVYRDLLDGGAAGVVSVHISSRLSGTVEAAQLAAEEFKGRVMVVDSLTAGGGVGFVALAAVAAARAGAEPEEVRRTALATADRIRTFFYVDTLEFLRRGGRISAASALFGTALAVKPILHVAGGEVVLREKVRTASRALARMVELATEVAAANDVDIAVQHLAAADRANALRAALLERLGGQVRDSFVADVGAVIGAHTGPGVIGVTVHRRA
jgi:DegV family protein with EDD domain